jgi:hypothetical protein
MSEDWKNEPSCWVGIRHRAFGSSSVYFGPFTTYTEFENFCEDNDLQLLAVELVHPDSDKTTWWDR